MLLWKWLSNQYDATLSLDAKVSSPRGNSAEKEKAHHI